MSKTLAQRLRLLASRAVTSEENRLLMFDCARELDELTNLKNRIIELEETISGFYEQKENENNGT